MPGKSKKAAFSKYLLLPLSVVLCALLIEAGLRVLKLPIASFYKVTCIVEADEELGYKFRPNATSHLVEYHEIDNIIYTNSLGFHDIERNLDSTNGRLRILAIGDSFTAAGQVAIEQGWTQTMERALASRSVDVINLGIDGTGTDAHLALLKKYAPLLKPDVVILAFFENDFDDVLSARRLACYDGQLLVFQTEAQRQQLISFFDAHKPNPFAYKLAQTSYLFRAVYPLLVKGGFLVRSNVIAPGNIGVPLEPQKEVPPAFFDDLFRDFLALAEEYHFQLLLVPVPGKADPARSITILQETVSADVLSQIPVINVYPEMQEQLTLAGKKHEDIYFVYDGHFNRDGYRLFGEAVARAVGPYLVANP